LKLTILIRERGQPTSQVVGIENGIKAVLRIQSQVRFARFIVRAMALKAMICKYGPNITCKVYGYLVCCAILG
tara:strand:- start:168 stop:386 length:219 start_codon:yes stop_codon:yes gene_type:complete